MPRLLLLAAFLLSAPAAAQRVLFVDADATGAAAGSSWADAFADLQDALATAEAGDAVWVAEGTYRPADGADRDASFVLVSGTALYGGFDGTEATLDERDPATHVTVLSGDVGAEGDISDNAYHVVVASGVDSTTVLDGFTVTGGYGNGANPRNRGAGFYAENASLVVRGCRIVENRVVQTDGFGGGGGAFFETSGSPRFERVAFEHNGLNGIGGGLWLLGEGGARSEAEVARRYGAPGYGEVESLEGGGGATERGGLSAVLREVTFVENTASFSGGADVDSAPVVMVGAAFVRNRAHDAGGGLFIGGTEGHLVNVGFYGNAADPNGFIGSSGGMNASATALTLTNVAFVGNTARLTGAFGQGGGTSVITNVTFTANEADERGGIRLANGAEALVRNAILWANEGGEIFDGGGTATVSHALILGGFDGDAILDADPRFVRSPTPGPDGAWGTADDDYGDLRLQEGSPAVDFGLTGFLPPDTFDLDGDGDTAEPLPVDLAGEPRVAGPGVDLGAYERAGPVAAEAAPSTPAAVLDAYPSPARGPVTVGLHLARAQRAEVAVYDVLGRRVAVLHDGPLAAGPHALRLETASLPAGVYVVRLEGVGQGPRPAPTARVTLVR